MHEETKLKIRLGFLFLFISIMFLGLNVKERQYEKTYEVFGNEGETKIIVYGNPNYICCLSETFKLTNIIVNENVFDKSVQNVRFDEVIFNTKPLYAKIHYKEYYLFKYTLYSEKKAYQYRKES
jgi:hypothetical protein